MLNYVWIIFFLVLLVLVDFGDSTYNSLRDSSQHLGNNYYKLKSYYNGWQNDKYFTNNVEYEADNYIRGLAKEYYRKKYNYLYSEYRGSRSTEKLHRDDYRYNYHGQQFHNGHEDAKEFTNRWTAHIPGGADVAQLMALEMGYVFGGQVGDFPDTYILIKDDHGKSKRNPGHEITKTLTSDPRVTWAEQLFIKQRVKRDFLDETLHSENTTTQYSQRNVSEEAIRVRRGDLPVPSGNRVMFNDELWSQEWYLQDTRTDGKLPKLDLNVVPVYRMGITGKGVRVTVLDDGLEHSHDDLKPNYDPEISWDCNDEDNDPTPRYDENHRNGHGTRCAGEIAMVANNAACGVGVAYGSSIGGVRLLDSQVDDTIEGKAIGYAWDKVDIYSASWGPNDDGKTVEGPGILGQKALERGITQGRNGKGVIFVWANGNGGSRGDNCNCDGYTGSVYTVSVGSASQRGAFPWYGEVCASTLAVTYSSGAYEDQMIATTDLNNTCTVRHTGTSASAPLAAGIVALALEVNPNLSWRDVQHLIVWTSEYAPLADNLGWQVNRVGFRFDLRFGFGLMNAHALVAAASNWTNVPNKSTCRVDAEPSHKKMLSTGESVTLLFKPEGCVCVEQVRYLEHVELQTNIDYTRRGALEIHLTSPGGTRIQLLSPRPLDSSTRGFINWHLSSVGTWGEDAWGEAVPGENMRGVWIAEVSDKVGPGVNRGYLGPFTLILHGTKERPAYMANGPRQYNYDYNIMKTIKQNMHYKLHQARRV